MSKTLAERLTDAQALVAKLAAQIEQERILSDIQANDNVTFSYGRDKTKRTLDGTVTATDRDSHGALWAAITSGTGLDTKVYKVRATDITANRTADERRAA